MKSNLVRLFAGTVVTLSLLGSVSVVQASSLSSTQVSAIISLLQAFGADQGVINNVSATLGGGQTISTLTCASFSDVTYGTFDDAVGGRVSQLQTWLGIPSNTFGFGTYGKKTQALWNSKCSGVVTPSTTTTVSNVPLHAEPLSGAAPLTVLFNTGTTPATSIFFGDGLHADLVDGYCTRGNCSISHTYLASGTYTAIIKDANEKTSGRVRFNRRSIWRYRCYR